MGAWAKMPCSWQGKPEMQKRLGELNSGICIAAMKLYIALCLKANFNSQDSLPAPGCVKRSVEQLAASCSVSKPLAIAGLKALQDLEFVTVIEGRPRIYQIADYESAAYWTKLPKEYLNGSGKRDAAVARLADVPNRGPTAKLAMQMYLYLACIRERGSNRARVTYMRMMEVFGVQKSDLSRAISLLVSCHLITVRLAKADEIEQGQRPSNLYWLRGMDAGAPQVEAA